MYRVAHVQAYDMLGDVCVSALLRTYEPNGEDFDARSLSASVQVRGTGEPQDAAWLKAALLALAEDL